MYRILILLLSLPLVVFTANASDLEAVKKTLKNEFRFAPLESIKETPVKGLYEISVGGSIAYVSADGRYLVQGDIVDRKTNKNITKSSILDSITDEDTIVFAPKKPKYTVTVFTDTDCGYCRKLHSEISVLNESGIKVRYMMFPRAGPDSRTAKTLESIWCSDNPQKAMDEAKNGGVVEEKLCGAPISKHMQIARALGLQGTPFMVTSNGTPINGYLPAVNLLEKLQAEAGSVLK